jgi:mRNA interferase MazF
MPTSDAFAPGTVVRVPFPYTEATTRQHRPALVVAATRGADAPFLLWVVMITSAANRGWPGDVEIPELGDAGLPAASVVRPAKIATIDRARAEPRGSVGAGTLAAVRSEIARVLGLNTAPASGNR